MLFSYVRVSTNGQNPQRQIDAIKQYNPNIRDENIFIDVESGKDFDRSEYQKLKLILRKGDTLIIKELDRLGRNKDQIREELKEYKNKGVILRILNIPTTLIELDNTNAWVIDLVNNILVEVLGAFAEEEREKLRLRQAEGIAIAKKQGKYKGRKPIKLSDDFPKLYKRWKKGHITATEFTQLIGYKSRSTLYKKIEKFENEFLNANN